jgi:hypothetical protein
MLLQLNFVQFQHRLRKHPYGQVNKLELGHREVRAKGLEQLVGKLRVVLAVRTVAAQRRRIEVQPLLAQGIDDLVALLTQFVLLDQAARLTLPAPSARAMDRYLQFAWV